MRQLVRKLQDRQRRPRLRQTNFWIGDELNERLVSASAHFGVGSKSMLVRVLLEDALDRLQGLSEDTSTLGAWTVEVETEYENARMLVLAEERDEAEAVLEAWLEGSTPANYDAEAMQPYDGARVLFMERTPRDGGQVR